MGERVFHALALTNQFEGRMQRTVGAALKMAELALCYSTVTLHSSVQKGSILWILLLQLAV